ncbi:hypothetical protein DOS84_03495 [Flavobacterium aquariorum]|uniref:Fibronectin type-III domain-containing protein n=1 Tax=Flavobacterium aquariorum TaxID=2217670 RepID=A0A2W7UMP4_9FLAO|nr:fibronectin type III domain-containing protein [Flavobacterium aquariorum]PZX94635.1 hypothetical protein DOS84_03495 [Flavobacterium aquariorum]
MNKYTSGIVLFLLFSTQIMLSQNSVSYSPSSTTISANSGVEVLVPITVTCSGNMPTTLVGVQPANTCSNIDGYTGINYTDNITSLTPGHSTVIKFKFKKTVTANTSITYLFTNNGSCNSPQIRITVNYIGAPITIPTCNLPIATGIDAKGLQNAITIKWNKVPGAVSYTFGYSTNGVSGSSVLLLDNVVCNSTTCTQTITNLTSNTKYDWQLRAECSTNFPDYYSGNWAFGSVSTLPPPPCPTSKPTNLNATPLDGAWRISFVPVPNVTYYTMEYFDLVSNSGGATQIAYSSAPDYYYCFFYNIPSNHNFKFRFLQECNMHTDWVTILAPTCERPTGLNIYNSGGTGTFNWIKSANSQMYNGEYMIYNLAGQKVSGTFSTSSTSYATTIITSSISGEKFIKFRVKSKCLDGGETDFSAWSNANLWNN